MGCRYFWEYVFAICKFKYLNFEAGISGGRGGIGGLVLGGVPKIRTLSGRSRAGHLHLGRQHVHWRIHDGIVLF